jgi:hypothetical protein
MQVIRVYEKAGNMVEMHEQADDLSGSASFSVWIAQG